MRILAAVVMCALFVPSVVCAEERFDRGSFRISLGIDSAAGDLSPDIAYFVANNLELVVHFDAQSLKIENTSGPDDELKTTALGAAMFYDFRTNSSMVPFLGVGLVGYHTEVVTAGVKTNDTDEVQLSLAAGLRFLLGERGSVDLTLTGTGGSLEDNLSSASVDFSHGQVGISYSLFL